MNESESSVETERKNMSTERDKMCSLSVQPDATSEMNMLRETSEALRVDYNQKAQLKSDCDTIQYKFREGGLDFNVKNSNLFHISSPVEQRRAL